MSDAGVRSARAFEPTADGYILNVEQAADAYRGNEDFFQPTPAMVESFEETIARNGRPTPGKGRLYAGFLLDGRQVLYVKFICAEVMRTHPWDREVPAVTDGFCLSHALYDVESRRVEWSTFPREP